MYMQKLNSNMVRFYSKNAYYDALELRVNYLKPETVQCNLDRPTIYLETYQQAFLSGREKLEIGDVISKNFNAKNYDNDLAFGCFSLSKDFDFKGNKNVLDITLLK